jgi:hypothetical protein
MQLSYPQYDTLVRHLEKYWKTTAGCSICSGNDWDVPRVVYELREFQGTSIVPTIPVTCKICGWIILINPLISGVELKGNPGA